MYSYDTRNEISGRVRIQNELTTTLSDQKFEMNLKQKSEKISPVPNQSSTSCEKNWSVFGPCTWKGRLNRFNNLKGDGLVWTYNYCENGTAPNKMIRTINCSCLTRNKKIGIRYSTGRRKNQIYMFYDYLANLNYKIERFISFLKFCNRLLIYSNA